jgi:hypothetical protein
VKVDITVATAVVKLNSTDWTPGDVGRDTTETVFAFNEIRLIKESLSGCA